MNRQLFGTALSLIVASPLAAQGATQAPSAPVQAMAPGDQIDRLAEIVDRDARRGLISAADAKWFRAELASLRRLHQRYRNFEPRTREHADLMRRIDALQARILAAERQRFTQPRAPRLQPPDLGSPFETPRRPSLIDPDRSLEQARLRAERDSPSDLGRDELRDMNDLRGPAPDKHDEGH